MLKRSTVAALMLAASEQALARNAAAQWDREEAQKNGRRFEEDDEFVKYAEFAEAIAYWGYSWEPVIATTRDGYKLTMFHITGGPPEGFVRPELPDSSSSEDENEE